MNVNDVVAEKVEAARRKIENDKRRRAELAAARQRGLAARRAAKIRHLQTQGILPAHQGATSTPPDTA